MAKKNSNKLIYILLSVVVFLIVLMVIGKSAGWFGKGNVKEVETVEVSREDIVEKVSASGMVQPVVEVKLSPDVSGELIEVNFEEGDSVKVGDVLIRIREDNYRSFLDRAVASYNQQQANLASALANLARSQAQFERQDLDYQRQKSLHTDGVISDAEFQTATANYKVSLQDLEASKQNVEAGRFLVKSSAASVDDARENLRKTVVESPMNGTISKLNVEKGERVVGTSQMTGTEMLRIADLNKMEVMVNVNENDIIRVNLGDTAIIDVDSYSHLDKKFIGVVTAIANTANSKVSMDAVTEFEVRILILNDSYKDLVAEGRKIPFRPGMTASVDIITNRKSKVIAVPLAAVTTRDSKKKSYKEKQSEEEQGGDEAKQEEDEKIVEIVFVAVDGVAKTQVVTTGISDYDNIQILSGLEEGQVIISGPFLAVSKRLEDGDLIEVKKEDKEKNIEE